MHLSHVLCGPQTGECTVYVTDSKKYHFTRTAIITLSYEMHNREVYIFYQCYTMSVTCQKTIFWNGLFVILAYLLFMLIIRHMLFTPSCYCNRAEL